MVHGLGIVLHIHEADALFTGTIGVHSPPVGSLHLHGENITAGPCHVYQLFSIGCVSGGLSKAFGGEARDLSGYHVEGVDGSGEKIFCFEGAVEGKGGVIDRKSVV